MWINTITTLIAVAAGSCWLLSLDRGLVLTPGRAAQAARLARTLTLLCIPFALASQMMGTFLVLGVLGALAFSATRLPLPVAGVVSLVTVALLAWSPADSAVLAAVAVLVALVRVPVPSRSTEQVDSRARSGLAA